MLPLCSEDIKSKFRGCFCVAKEDVIEIEGKVVETMPN
ncbi:translation initiation factor IF-1, partial [Streptococcus pyogenes]